MAAAYMSEHAGCERIAPPPREKLGCSEGSSMQQPAQPFLPLEHVSHNCRSARFSHSRYWVRLFQTVTVLVCMASTGTAAQSSSADAQTLLRKAQASLAAGNFAE